MVRLLVAGAFSLTLLVAQTATDPKTLASLSGRITNLAGEPLKKAEVLLRPMVSAPNDASKPYGATSDAQGNFSIDGITPGRFTMMVERIGYLTQTYGAKPGAYQGTTITLAAGQSMGDIQVKLSPQSVISGKVIDEDGDPIRASIRILRSQFYRGKRQLMASGGEQSDDRGEFRLHDLAPGRYYLSVTPLNRFMMGDTVRRPAGKPGEPEMAYVTTYYPGTPDVAAAAPIEITAGHDVAGVNIQIKKSEVYHVKGKLTGVLPDVPLNQIRISVLSRDMMMGFGFDGSGAALKDGTFDLANVRPGSWNLVAMRAQGMLQVLARQPIEIGSQSLENVVLAIQPLTEVTGTVQVEPASAASNTPPAMPTGVRITLNPADNSMSFNAPDASVKADGSFTIANVPQGSYRFGVYAIPAGAYLKAIRSGEQDITRQPFEVSGPAKLDIVLSMAAAQVTGTVQDEKQQPAVGATVTLHPDPAQPEQADLYRQTSTDQNGAFVLKGLAPGKYRVYAWDNLEAGQQMDPEFMRPHLSQGEPVQLDANGNAQVTAKLIAVTPQ